MEREGNIHVFVKSAEMVIKILSQIFSWNLKFNTNASQFFYVILYCKDHSSAISNRPEENSKT